MEDTTQQSLTRILDLATQIGSVSARYLLTEIREEAARAIGKANDPIRTLLAAHAGLIAGGSHYAYFELAYTRQTGWMARLCTNAKELDPNRKIIASGQGSAPDEACEKALAQLPEFPPDDYPFAQPGNQ